MTTGGAPSTGIVGTPADSVNYALDTLELQPHLVISGINKGQNVGPGVPDSGTVGAARTAARRGVPALAVSQGFDVGLDVPDYTAGVQATVKWLKSHRKALTPKKGASVQAFVDNLNVPTCAAGTKPRGTLEVPIGTDRNYIAVQDCASTVPAPSEDVLALNAGYITLTPSIPF
jgi:5'-nucleotidase